MPICLPPNCRTAVQKLDCNGCPIDCPECPQCERLTCPELRCNNPVISYDENGCEKCPECPVSCVKLPGKCAPIQCENPVWTYNSDGCKVCLVCPRVCEIPTCTTQQCNNWETQYTATGCFDCPKCLDPPIDVIAVEEEPTPA